MSNISIWGVYISIYKDTGNSTQISQYKTLHNGDNNVYTWKKMTRVSCTAAHNFPYTYNNTIAAELYTKLLQNFLISRNTIAFPYIEIPEYHKSLHNKRHPYHATIVENLQYTCKMSSTPKCVRFSYNLSTEGEMTFKILLSSSFMVFLWIM